MGGERARGQGEEPEGGGRSRRRGGGSGPGCPGRLSGALPQSPGACRNSSPCHPEGVPGETGIWCLQFFSDKWRVSTALPEPGRRFLITPPPAPSGAITLLYADELLAGLQLSF